jgi:hypothetical protein
MFVSGCRGGVMTALLQDALHSLVAPAARLTPEAGSLATLVGNEAAWSVATWLAIKVNSLSGHAEVHAEVTSRSNQCAVSLDARTWLKRSRRGSVGDIIVPRLRFHLLRGAREQKTIRSCCG